MKKNRLNRIKSCFHCGNDFAQKRSDQKFCRNSCRSSNHQMNKPKTMAVNGISAELEVQKPLKSIGNAFLGSAGAILAEQAVYKLGGVHNHDLLKAIEELKKDQKVSNPNDLAEALQLLRGIYKILNAEKSKNESWMLNIR